MTFESGKKKARGKWVWVLMHGDLECKDAVLWTVSSLKRWGMLKIWSSWELLAWWGFFLLVLLFVSATEHFCSSLEIGFKWNKIEICYDFASDTCIEFHYFCKSVGVFGFWLFFHSLTTMTFSEKGLVCTWVVLIVVKMVNNLHFKKAAHISICPLLLLKLVLQMCLSK